MRKHLAPQDGIRQVGATAGWYSLEHLYTRRVEDYPDTQLPSGVPFDPSMLTPDGYRRAKETEFRNARSGFLRSVTADVDAFCVNRGEAIVHSRTGKLRTAFHLCYKTDDFLALMCYRLRTSLYDAGVPIIPRVLHFLSAQLSGVRIGNWVLIGEGAYIPHGQVVIDGFVRIGRGAILNPWTTIGLKQGSFEGPTLGENVFVGTGAKVLGAIHVGANARIGANAVVLSDVPAGATAVGAPARMIERGPPDET